jgi:hypothetical protein
MLAIAETHARFKAECFYRPSRDGGVFLHHFPVRRGGYWAFAGSLRDRFLFDLNANASYLYGQCDAPFYRLYVCY